MTTFRTRLAGFTASISALFLGTYSLAFAQSAKDIAKSGAGSTPLGSFLLVLVSIINDVLVPLLFAAAFIVFIWGMFRYFILGATNEEKRSEGQKLLIYGLIGFFVMLSLWGIVNVLTGTFNFGSNNQPAYPTFNVNGQASNGSQASPTVLPASTPAPAAAQTDKCAFTICNQNDYCNPATGKCVPASTQTAPAAGTCIPANCPSHICQSATACLP